MGNNISQVYAAQQSYISSILQSQSATCGASQDVNITNNTTIVTGSDLNNVDVGVSASGQQVNAACMMSNSMNDQVSALLSSVLQQTGTSESDFLSIFSKSSDITQSAQVAQNISNVVTQLTQSTCTSNQVTDVADNYTYVSGVSDSNAFLGVSVSGQSANATCTLNNFSKLLLYNQAQAQTDQQASQFGTFAALALAGVAIVFLLVVVIGIVVLAGVIGGSAVKAYSSSRSRGNAPA